MSICKNKWCDFQPIVQIQKSDEYPRAYSISFLYHDIVESGIDVGLVYLNETPGLDQLEDDMVMCLNEEKEYSLVDLVGQERFLHTLENL